MIFGDPAIEMLQNAAGKVRIVAGVSIDGGRGASPEEMWADCDAKRQASGLGYYTLDGRIGHALAGIGRQPERPSDIGQRVGRTNTLLPREAILRVCAMPRCE
jgi:hypothetical protein